MRSIIIAFLLLSGVAVAQDQTQRTYSENGTIIAVRKTEKSHNVPVHTDAQGKTWGGVTAHHPFHVYRVETETRFYEFEESGKNPGFTIGQQIQFRLEKERLFIKDGNKEKKYDVTDVEKKNKNPSPKSN